MTARVRTKICGITRPEDALLAVEAGADAIGLVFYEPSPRYVTVSMARKICAALPPLVSVVGLFVNHSRAEVMNLVHTLPLNLLQFHGDEKESDCLGYGLPYMKAVRVRSDQCVEKAEGLYSQASGLLVDTYQAGVAGGTGKSFDWGLLPAECGKPLILAGGLTPENVADAIQQVRPYAVDVSGGVERAKGLKDKDKVTAFCRAVNVRS